MTVAAAVGTDGRFAAVAEVGLIVGDVSAAGVTVGAIPVIERNVRTLTVVAGEGLLNDLEEVAKAARAERVGQRRTGLPFTEPFAQDVGMGNIRPAGGRMR